MALVDLGTFLDDDALDTPPIPSRVHPEGRSYRIPSPDWRTGLALSKMVNLGLTAAAGRVLTEEDAASIDLDDSEERDFAALVLGDAAAQMAADGVSWTRVQRLAQYALLFFTLGAEAASKVVKAAAQGEAKAPNRATRRSSTSPRVSSGGAKSTPRRGSHAATTVSLTPSA